MWTWCAHGVYELMTGVYWCVYECRRAAARMPGMACQIIKKIISTTFFLSLGSCKLYYQMISNFPKMYLKVYRIRWYPYFFPPMSRSWEILVRLKLLMETSANNFLLTFTNGKMMNDEAVREIKSDCKADSKSTS